LFTPAAERVAAQAPPVAPTSAEPIPQPVGADVAGSDIPDPPAQNATALQKMVTQSAEDRMTPQFRDDNVYVPGTVYSPGVERPEAMRDFAPATGGNLSAALAHKMYYNMDAEYRGAFDKLVKKNNDVMVDGIHARLGDANSRDAAFEEAKELMPGQVGLFDRERPVDSQPIVDEIKNTLAGPAGKRDSVKSLFEKILPKLENADGNLEDMPSMIKGVRDDITDKLYDKSPTVEGNAARTARNQLQNLLRVVDRVIASGLPGTKYQDYLSNLSSALGEVSRQDFLQRYLTGPKKLTDLAGNLIFQKVQNMLGDIQAHHADRTGDAKEVSMDDINYIEAVRNELAAKDMLARRASVPGSPTIQLGNVSGVLGNGPMGAGVRGAAEIAAHAVLALKTAGVGNAALAAYRYIYRPMVDAANNRQSAAATAEAKQRLLDTTPRSSQ
jgi:hypothetical protein